MSLEKINENRIPPQLDMVRPYIWLRVTGSWLQSAVTPARTTTTLSMVHVSFSNWLTSSARLEAN